MLDPEVHILHRSDFYQIRNFKCNCTACGVSQREYHRIFNFCFVRSGYFEYQLFRSDLEVHVGRVLVMKPDFDHYTRHINNQPDVCTVLDFTPDFYELLKEYYKDEAGWFFNNKDLHAMVLKCSAEMDYLHHMILKTKASNADHLLIDEWVMRLVGSVLRTLGNVQEVKPVPDNLKKLHLVTVEKAKNFILTNYDQNISLQQLSDHCCVSLFHFCRLFSTIMKMSPYQYLSEIRLHHARVLLETSSQPIMEIAFQCGYSSAENFTNAYRHFFKLAPSGYRRTFL